MLMMAGSRLKRQPLVRKQGGGTGQKPRTAARLPRVPPTFRFLPSLYGPGETQQQTYNEDDQCGFCGNLGIRGALLENLDRNYPSGNAQYEKEESGSHQVQTIIIEILSGECDA